MRRFPAVLAALIALPLLAQTSLIEQGRAAMNRNDADAAATLLEKAVAQNPKSGEAHYLNPAQKDVAEALKRVS